MFNRLTSLIFGPGPATPDIHIGPKPPTPDIHIGPTPPTSVPPHFFPRRSSPVNWDDSFRRSVRLFDEEMTSVGKDQFTETWNCSFELICVQVKFDSRNTSHPWTAIVGGQYSITSHPFEDVRRVEKWAEKVLLRIRDQIPAGPRHMIAEYRRREALRSKAWQPLPREPLELECFAVKADDGEYCIIQKAPFPRGEHQWMTKLSKVTAVWTWDVILSKFSQYCELPPV